jgi:hypothetical protein
LVGSRPVDNATGPGIDLALGIRQLAFGQTRQIGDLVLSIGEREQFGSRIEDVNGSRRAFGMMQQVERRC